MKNIYDYIDDPEYKELINANKNVDRSNLSELIWSSRAERTLEDIREYLDVIRRKCIQKMGAIESSKLEKDFDYVDPTAHITYKAVVDESKVLDRKIERIHRTRNWAMLALGMLITVLSSLGIAMVGNSYASSDSPSQSELEYLIQHEVRIQVDALMESHDQHDASHQSQQSTQALDRTAPESLPDLPKQPLPESVERASALCDKHTDLHYLFYTSEYTQRFVTANPIDTEQSYRDYLRCIVSGKPI